MARAPDCVTIIAGMTSNAESSRKLAAYHLQSLVVDSSFVDAFVQADGMAVLKTAVMEEQGNALAYSLGSFTGLLEKDVGWEAVTPDVIERAVQLVIDRPSINVLRNVLFLLVLVVSRPIDQVRSSRPASPSSANGDFGIAAVMPLLQMHDSFLHCLVDKLASADHALCANALNLINALIRDSIINSASDQRPQLIFKLQELGVTGAVERLMRGGDLPDLVTPLLEFQGLRKVLLARWRGVRVETERPDHRAMLSQVHVSSSLPDHPEPESSQPDKLQLHGSGRERAPDKWRRLGFNSEKPVRDFEDAGYLGLMDLSEYVRKNIETFQNTLLEQSVVVLEQRCPLTRASLSVTMLLYEYFDVESIMSQDIGSSLLAHTDGNNLQRHVEPLILRWDRLHSASLDAFLKLWKEAGAVAKDYHKIEDLTRLLIGKVLGTSNRKGTTEQVERELVNVGLSDVRKWQLTELEEAYGYAWGADLSKLRQGIHDDSLLFLKEQRIRCLLQGSWFPVISALPPANGQLLSPQDISRPTITAWRFVRLSHDRVHLHHASHPRKLDRDPELHELLQRVDLNGISSVDSSVSRALIPVNSGTEAIDSPEGVAENHSSSTGTITSLTIYGTPISSLGQVGEEKVLLELNTGSSSLASEWLDGLLMLLNQQPITADTNKLIDILEDWTIKVRMSNLRWEDVDWERAQTGAEKVLPPRPTDRNYWYDMGV